MDLSIRRRLHAHLVARFYALFLAETLVDNLVAVFLADFLVLGRFSLTPRQSDSAQMLPYEKLRGRESYPQLMPPQISMKFDFCTPFILHAIIFCLIGTL
jgi:hypothetical protein